MIRQILLNHFFHHLSNCRTKIALRQKMSAPALLLYIWKLLKQLTGYSPFDTPHNFTRSHIRRTTHQNMHMVFANNSSNNPYLKRLAHQPDTFAYPNPAKPPSCSYSTHDHTFIETQITRSGITVISIYPFNCSLLPNQQRPPLVFLKKPSKFRVIITPFTPQSASDPTPQHS